MTPALSSSSAALLVDRFVAAYGQLAAAVRTAVEKQQSDPLARPSAWMPWRDRVLPLLEKRLAAIRSAAASSRDVDSSTIRAYAQQECGLARNLDSYNPAFAGPGVQAQLEELVTLVVQAAYRVAHDLE